jgi:antitoxin component YwqK of YwqJK toxin-antitoxin module
MKKYMIIGAVLISGMISAQNIEPKLEAIGNTVKATYYYDNGNIQQQGFFKDGKLDGKWIAFDINGNKKSTGEYAQGQKTGKWFIWSEDNLSEVDYSDSKIALVKNWKKEAIVNRN